MSDAPPSPPERPKKPDSSYLSFANPNYCMDGQGHTDLQSPTDDDDPLSFGRLSLGEDGHTTDRQAHANSDYSSGDVTPSSPDRSFILQKLSSQTWDQDDKEEGDTDDDTSSLEDEDSEMTHNLLGSQDDVRDETVYQTVAQASSGSKKSRGILGYLAMLEMQAKGEGVEDGSVETKRIGVLKKDVEEEEEVGGEDFGVVHTPDELDGDLLEVPVHKLQNGTDINSPDSHDSGIQSDIRLDKAVKHVHGPVTDDIYAIVEKQNGKKGENQPDAVHNGHKIGENEESSEDNTEEQAPADVLPPGWEKHEDEDGAYYWHIKSGTIQRDPPPPAPPDGPSLCTAGTVRSGSVSFTSDSSSQDASSVPSTPTSVTSNTERHLQEFEGHALQYAAKSLHTLTSQKPSGLEDIGVDSEGNRPVRFAVRSLGWVSIAEGDLTPERSSKAVNKCIMDLSLGRHDINDAVGRWGQGKDLYMDIDSRSLRLIDPADFTVLNSQAIHSIRVWGVGRDNGRDFAYVARDRATRMHMCHVFQCDTPARQIANTLRDICKRIMQERGLQVAPPATDPSRVARPTDLPNLDKTTSLMNSVTFPTPMEEPRKVIRCHYLGSNEVVRPTGTDMINESIDWMYHHVPPEKWTFVNVAIAPSTITITEHGNPDNILDECRVRFMSFMGISITNVKLCAFVMHTAQNKFVSHVFHCEPSAGPLCKTIEAACKLRYQKCLDAHPQTPRSAHNGKKLSHRLKKSMRCVWGSVTQLVSPK